MKLRALIIDDEPLAHKVILTYAEDIPSLNIVGQCYLATEALDLINKEEIDLIFLDINMPKLQGLDFLRTLDKKPIVIITSAYEEYALEGFELAVCDYLLKPFRFERFLKAVNKAFSLFQVQQKPLAAPSLPKENQAEVSNQLFIKSDKKLIQIDLAEIYFLESYGNYVKLWMKDKFHLTARTLSSFEDQLPSTDFIRVQKSFIIHRKFIDYVESNHVFMKNEKMISIGKNYRQEFKRFLLEG